MAGSPAPRLAHCITLALRQLAPFRSRFMAASCTPPGSLHYARAAPARSIPFAIHGGVLHPAWLTALRSRCASSLHSVRDSWRLPAPRLAHCITLALRQLAPFRSQFMAASSRDVSNVFLVF